MGSTYLHDIKLLLQECINVFITCIWILQWKCICQQSCCICSNHGICNLGRNENIISEQGTHQVYNNTWVKIVRGSQILVTKQQTCKHRTTLSIPYLKSSPDNWLIQPQKSFINSSLLLLLMKVLQNLKVFEGSEINNGSQ